ncbi:MAG TPA: DUF1003 domain-containing protein [Pseudonocardia sp.]|nr:DUF1003 domain-containing protein [Pseudonocardia sp.]
MPELHSNRRLDLPRAGRSRRFSLDPDAFARMSERVARFLGTGRFLAIQTIIVAIWITLNLTALVQHWDPYPFILLNLAFSTQAAYAAPLILLAQNRQDDRDRVSLEEDRTRAAQTKADTEYLARELASLRVAVGEVVTRDYLRGELERLAAVLQAEPTARPGKSDRAGKLDRSTKPDRAGRAT